MRNQIIEYHSELRNEVETFRRKSMVEGNLSLDQRKFDPDAIAGNIWCAYHNDELVSLGAGEISHYTNEENVVRFCRYHILKSHRHGRYGFKILELMAQWCVANDIKLLYWTHDVNNRSLNELYQRKRQFAFGSQDLEWFSKDPFNRLVFHTDRLFKTGNMLQFVYSICFDDSFDWKPQSGNYLVYYQHDGKIPTLDEVLGSTSHG